MGWIGGPLEVRTHSLPPPGLACVMQDLKLLSFNVQWFRDLGALCLSFGCFVFESWVLRFQVFGASFSRFGCFVLRSSFSKVLGASFLSPGCTVFEFSVLHFRDLGASCFGLRFRVLRFRNYRGKHYRDFTSLRDNKINDCFVY